MNNLWAIGFRPFFLLGSLTSMLLVLFWAWVFYSGITLGGYFDPIVWHAHEMIYGFTLAIVAGFLLTASPNWTQSKALSGLKLKRLFCLWFLGRVLMALSFFEWPYLNYAASLVDLLFIPFLITSLAPPLLKARRLSNSQFLLILGILGIGNLLIHLASLNIIDSSYANKAIYLGVNLILLIIVIIGGRIVPAFTSNALRVEAWKWPVIEYFALGSLWAYILLSFFMDDGKVIGWIALFGGLFNLLRMAGWNTLKTLKYPLLWILHMGYLWIIIGFFLIFLSDVVGILPRSVAIHAFTAGSMGTMIIGMMSRVSLGHSGRPLHLAKGFISSYIFITLSGVIRVASGFYMEHYTLGILLAGFFWGLSFLIFLIYYSRILILPRAGGRPG